MVRIRSKPSACDFAQWLRRFSWDLWGTYTFAYEVSDVRGWALFDGYLKLLRTPDRRMDAFVAIERGSLGRLHLHALIAGAAQLPARCNSNDCRGRVRCATHAWTHGLAQVATYDPSRAACLYIAKHLHHGNWHIVGKPLESVQAGETDLGLICKHCGKPRPLHRPVYCSDECLGASKREQERKKTNHVHDFVCRTCGHLSRPGRPRK
jgi:hypothetical protein